MIAKNRPDIMARRVERIKRYPKEHKENNMPLSNLEFEKKNNLVETLINLTIEGKIKWNYSAEKDEYSISKCGTSMGCVSLKVGTSPGFGGKVNHIKVNDIPVAFPDGLEIKLYDGITKALQEHSCNAIEALIECIKK